MAKVIVFGVLDTAQLACYYLTHDSDHSVVAFSVNAAYMPESGTFEGRPVVPFETIEHHYPPTEYAFFAPMTYRRMNRLREQIYCDIKAKGYQLISYVSSRATVFPNVQIGENCFVLEDNTLQPYTALGNNVVLWSGNHIGHHSVIHDHVFFTSHVVLSGHCVVEPYCFFGVNSTVRDATRLAEGTLVAMGACITGDTDAWGVYKGIPAQKGKRLSHELDV